MTDFPQRESKEQIVDGKRKWSTRFPNLLRQLVIPGTNFKSNHFTRVNMIGMGRNYLLCAIIPSYQIEVKLPVNTIRN